MKVTQIREIYGENDGSFGTICFAFALTAPWLPKTSVFISVLTGSENKKVPRTRVAKSYIPVYMMLCREHHSSRYVDVVLRNTTSFFFCRTACSLYEAAMAPFASPDIFCNSRNNSYHS